MAALRDCAGLYCDSLQGAVLTSLLRGPLQYRHVVLPPDIAQVLPKGRLLSEVRASTRSRFEPFSWEGPGLTGFSPSGRRNGGR